jgi:glycosyltransferase involved in cell wall biosynthesis
MKVSIVMTCYNTSHYVGEAIRSVVQQTYKNWELIIVDDASTDKTVRVVTKILSKLGLTKRSKLFIHKVNCGVGRSLHDGIALSSGELVAILDSDDTLHPNVLSLVVPPHIANKNISLVYTDYMHCNANLEHIRPVKNFQIPRGKSYMDYNLKGVSHLKCFKKSLYDKTQGVDVTLLKSVDKDLVLKLEEVGTLYYVNTMGYFHRQNPSSISHSFFRKPKEKQLEMRKARKDLVENARARRKLMGVVK